MNIPFSAVQAFRAHAMEDYPHEACGIITHDDQYKRLVNAAEDPEQDFLVRDSWDILPAAKVFLHTHTDNQRYASLLDMRQHFATAIPWGIALTDGMTVSPIYWMLSGARNMWSDTPLVGREFFHGVYDCYSLIRDYYFHMLNIRLGDYPRGPNWWQGNRSSMYVDFYPQEKFAEIPKSEAKPDDVLLMRCGHTYSINHAAILLDDGFILHHYHGRLSCKEPIGRWQKRIEVVLRYQG